MEGRKRATVQETTDRAHICILMDLIPSFRHVTHCMQTPRTLCPQRVLAVRALDWMISSMETSHTHTPAYSHRIFTLLPACVKMISGGFD